MGGLLGLRHVVVASQLQLVENWGLAFFWFELHGPSPALALSDPTPAGSSRIQTSMVGAAYPAPKALKVKEEHLEKGLIL